MKTVFTFMMLLSVLLLSACGQSGKLYLPENESRETKLTYTPLQQE